MSDAEDAEDVGYSPQGDGEEPQEEDAEAAPGGEEAGEAEDEEEGEGVDVVDSSEVGAGVPLCGVGWGGASGGRSPCRSRQPARTRLTVRCGPAGTPRA